MYCIKFLAKFRSFPRTFIFAQKQHHGSSVENSVSPGLVSFKSCNLESKTRAKVFGKVDTMETYHSADHNTSFKMLKEVIFPRFGTRSKTVRHPPMSQKLPLTKQWLFDFIDRAAPSSPLSWQHCMAYLGSKECGKEW